MLATRPVEIFESDDAVSLGQRMAEAGANLLLEMLPDILDGSIHLVDQPEDGAVYAPLLKKEDGLLDFNRTAVELSRKVRAFTPWPGSSFLWENQIIKIIKARIGFASKTNPAEKLVYEGYPAVACSEGILILEEIQPAGKKAMNGRVFLNGARSWGK
jgi:methionyl-tRNA formyltransferase